MTTAIRIHDLRKSFRTTQALAGLSFEVEEGDVFGFLGPNGAGKTTTMRILATLLRPDAGVAKIYDYDVVTQAKHVRPIIGYMPDSSGAYRDMLVSEYLEFFAAAYRIPIHQRQKVVDDCIELTGLGYKKNELIEGLSRGMRQRLGLARCLINDPKVLILDEPASGLDPRARIEIQEILRTLGSMKKTVLISSHILSELRQLCNKICIIDHGRLVYCGTIVDALARARTAKRLLVRLVDRQEEAGKLLAGHAHVVGVEATDSHLLVELDPTADDFSFVATDLVQNGYKVLTIREEEIMLEDAFIKLTDVGEVLSVEQPPAFVP
jgi:ABC-2 type transport system ATP-binding protein